MPHQKRSRTWNQPHPNRKAGRVDQLTHYEQDEIIFGIMGFALLVKIDRFFPEGFVKSRSSFQDG